MLDDGDVNGVRDGEEGHGEMDGNWCVGCRGVIAAPSASALVREWGNGSGGGDESGCGGEEGGGDGMKYEDLES
nr:hypothetical protein HmN_000292500 [Hymenolepis microstoma]